LIHCIAKELKVLGVLPSSIKIEGHVINLKHKIKTCTQIELLVMSNHTNQEKKSNNVVWSPNGVITSHKLTQIHITHYNLNLKRIMPLSSLTT
jgi:hypothetical protein